MNGNDQDIFDQQLADDAQACAPRFSIALHERVMRRVELVSKIEPPRRRDALRIWIGRSSVAAAATVAVLVTGWLFDHQTTKSTPSGSPLAALTAMDAIDEVIAERTRAVDDQLADARFAYLDQDVKSFATFVRGVMPSAPLPNGPS